MSIFTTPIDRLQTSDIADLLRDPAIENVRLEFKSETPEKDEMLKKLSSFANSFGGFMVIGAKANSADGRIESLPGVGQQSGFKQKVIQWCFDGANPPLVVEVSDGIPADSSGRVFYVLYTSESDVAPHFLNGRRGIWVRTDEFSQRFEPRLATEREIRHLLDRRQVVKQRREELVQRSARRFETFLSRQSKDEGENRTDSAARLELIVGPRFPARPVSDHGRLGAILQNCRINWRQTTFPHSTASMVSQHESMLYLMSRDARNRRSIIEANIWGVLFYGAELDIEIGAAETAGLLQNPISGIHVYRVVGHLLVFMEHARRLTSEVGYRGPLSIDVTLSGLLGVPWLYSEYNTLFTGPASELDDTFSFSLETTSEALSAGRDELVQDLLRYILFGVNWPAYASDPKTLLALLRTGYEYNFWKYEPALTAEAAT